MTSEKTWMIGAADQCDFVFDQPTVSGNHCQITKDENGYLLTDLQSTNGTFVNETRITDPAIVTPEDEIRLGKVIRFPWRLLGEKSSTHILRVGRSPNNDIVIDNPSVSFHHAQVITKGGQAVIQDLDSTNGIAIDSPENKIKIAEITPDSTIYFGVHTEPASRFLEASSSAKRSFTQTSLFTQISQWDKRKKVLFGSAIATLFLMIGAGTLFSLGNQKKSNIESPNNITNHTIPPNENLSGELALAKSRITLTPEHAVYSVLAQIRSKDGNAKNFKYLRIGSAFAITKTHLATSGSVALMVKQYQKDFSVIQVHTSVSNRAYEVKQAYAHSSFITATEEAKEFKTKGADVSQQINYGKRNGFPLSDNDVVKLKAESSELMKKQYLATERQVFYDVGLIEVDEALPVVLPLTDVAPSPNSNVQVVGVPFSINNSTFDFNVNTSPQKMKGVITKFQLLDAKQNQQVTRYLVKCAGSQFIDHWGGSPILNSNRKVLGVYSRSSLSQKRNESASKNHSVAPTAKRILELLGQVKK